MINESPLETFAVIRVVGVGGSGNNSIERMIQSKLRGVEFISINTDAQTLANNSAPTKIQIGKELTHGLGSGADLDVGKKLSKKIKMKFTKLTRGLIWYLSPVEWEEEQELVRLRKSLRLLVNLVH